MIFCSQMPLLWCQDLPFSSRQFAQSELANPRAQQAKCRMTDGCGHAPHLTIFAFDQLHENPTVGHILAKADWRIARWNFRLWLWQPRPAGQGHASLDQHASGKSRQIVGVRDSLHLHPILSLVA